MNSRLNPEQRFAELRQLSGALTSIDGVCAIEREQWDHIEITGGTDQKQAQAILALLTVLLNLGLLENVAIDVDNLSISPEEFAEQLQNEHTEAWRVSFSKREILERVMAHDPSCNVLIFATEAAFIAWADSINPFSDRSPTRAKPALLVIYPRAGEGWGGSRLAICNAELTGLPQTWPTDPELPTDPTIKSQVHNLLADPVTFDPNAFDLSWGALDTPESAPWRTLSAKALSACLVQDFAGDRVVLRGVRRLELRFSAERPAAPSRTDIEALRAAVKWVYQERVETRAKLLADRLSLELNEANPYLSQVAKLIPEAYKQAREQYGFVILERADQHAREVRDLLKDIRTQADFYAEKTRSILSSLLRDTLAILFLLTLTLISRTGSAEEVLATKEMSLMFFLAGLYLSISAGLQIIIHGRDVYLSSKEMEYWSNASRRYMNSEEVTNHIKSNITPRQTSFIALGGWLACIYLLFAVCCFNYLTILRSVGVLAAH